LISGAANFTGDTTEHAALWRDLKITDLGTLGGPNSRAGGASDLGLVVGWSETASPDPLGETVCSTFSYGFSGRPLICLGFVWQNNGLTALPTLGGNNSMASAFNNLGQIAGFAENSTHDPACPSPQVLDFEAVIWGPKPGQIQELPPLPGDTVGFAQQINDHGQAVGMTALCSNLVTGIQHAVLWQDGVPIDLGNLGSQLVNWAFTINELGQVAGGSAVTGDQTWHAFLWNPGDKVMRDLGVLAGDVMSQSNGINNKGQVVGNSCTDIYFNNCRAFIWQNGVMTDLNDLIPNNSSLHLWIADTINDRGEIVGAATDLVTGAGPGFVAFPCDGLHQNIEGCATATATSNVSPTVSRRAK
jgi:probable HAF family extracellular repeat protein